MMIRKFAPTGILSFDFNTKAMRALEWALTIASVAYAAYDPEWYWIAFASAAVILTAINPTHRIQTALRSRFIKSGKAK